MQKVPKINEENIINLTDKDIPNHVKMILQYGPKFCLNDEKTPRGRAIADIDYCFSKIKAEVKDDNGFRAMQNRVINVVGKYYSFDDNCPDNKFLSYCKSNTLKYIKENDDLIVTEADKASKTVVMFKHDYDKKIRELISDHNIYKSLQCDITSKLQTKNNSIVKKLFEKGNIELREKKFLTTYNCVPPKIYGLPKTHKPNVPLQPIIAFYDSPSYRISKFVNEVLRNLKNSESNIKNSFELIDRLHNVKIDKDDIMVSFDVVSLFTSIPLKLTKDCLDERWDEISKFTTVAKGDFLEVIEFCFGSSYFKYGNEFFQQINGLPMGSPLSPVISEIVLDKIFIEVKERFGADIKLMCKYVDDSIFVLNKCVFTEVQGFLDGFDNSLKFTFENEVNGRIAFLDVELIKKTDSILHKFYKKTIKSDRLINFKSFQPNHQKMNTARYLLTRMLNLTSEPFQREMIGNFRKVMRKNNYPSQQVEKIINAVKNGNKICSDLKLLNNNSTKAWLTLANKTLASSE